jgi:hypothetical protein
MSEQSVSELSVDRSQSLRFGVITHDSTLDM